MPKKIDMKGLTIGSIFVKEESEKRNKLIHWLCVCLMCGREFIVPTCSLKICRYEKGCGKCYQKNIGERVKKHGHTKNRSFTLTYNSWRGMKDRVTNEKHYGYKYYKENNITICERWNVFDNFLEDMGERPEGMTLDRTDNKKGYFKENCKWVSMVEQRRNRRDTVFFIYKEEKGTLKYFCEKYNIPYNTARSRISEGKKIEETIETKIRNKS